MAANDQNLTIKLKVDTSETGKISLVYDEQVKAIDIINKKTTAQIALDKQHADIIEAQNKAKLQLTKEIVLQNDLISQGGTAAYLANTQGIHNTIAALKIYNKSVDDTVSKLRELENSKVSAAFASGASTFSPANLARPGTSEVMNAGLSSSILTQTQQEAERAKQIAIALEQERANKILAIREQLSLASLEIERKHNTQVQNINIGDRLAKEAQVLTDSVEAHRKANIQKVNNIAFSLQQEERNIKESYIRRKADIEAALASTPSSGIAGAAKDTRAVGSSAITNAGLSSNIATNSQAAIIRAEQEAIADYYSNIIRIERENLAQRNFTIEAANNLRVIQYAEMFDRLHAQDAFNTAHDAALLENARLIAAERKAIADALARALLQAEQAAQARQATSASTFRGQSDPHIQALNERLSLEASIRVNGARHIRTLEIQAAQEEVAIRQRLTAELLRLENALREGTIEHRGQANLARLSALSTAERELAANNVMIESHRQATEAHRSLALRIIASTSIYQAYNSVINLVISSLKAVPHVGIELDATVASLSATVGEGGRAGSALASLEKEAARTGIEIGTLRENFRSFQASTSLAGQSIDSTWHMFTNLNTVMTGLHLTADKANGVFLAMAQIFNKNKVQSEELVKQLGNLLPGAFASFAEATGRSTEKLSSDMKNSLVTAGSGIAGVKGDVEKFTDYMSEKFAVSFALAAEGLNANLGRMKNSFTYLGEAIYASTSGPLVAYTKGITNITNYLTEAVKGNNDFGKGLSIVVDIAMAAAIVSLGKLALGFLVVRYEAISTAASIHGVTFAMEALAASKAATSLPVLFITALTAVTLYFINLTTTAKATIEEIERVHDAAKKLAEIKTPEQKIAFDIEQDPAVIKARAAKKFADSMTPVSAMTFFNSSKDDLIDPQKRRDQTILHAQENLNAALLAAEAKLNLEINTGKQKVREEDEKHILDMEQRDLERRKDLHSKELLALSKYNEATRAEKSKSQALIDLGKLSEPNLLKGQAPKATEAEKEAGKVAEQQIAIAAKATQDLANIEEGKGRLLQEVREKFAAAKEAEDNKAQVARDKELTAIKAKYAAEEAIMKAAFDSKINILKEQAAELRITQGISEEATTSEVYITKQQKNIDLRRNAVLEEIKLESQKANVYRSQLETQTEINKLAIANIAVQKDSVTTSTNLANKVMQVESGGNMAARNTGGGGLGAFGSMQIRSPAYSEVYKQVTGAPSDITKASADQLQEAGKLYLNKQLETFKYTDAAIAAYNQGPGKVSKIYESLNISKLSNEPEDISKIKASFTPEMSGYVNAVNNRKELSANTVTDLNNNKFITEELKQQASEDTRLIQLQKALLGLDKEEVTLKRESSTLDKQTRAIFSAANSTYLEGIGMQEKANKIKYDQDNKDRLVVLQKIIDMKGKYVVEAGLAKQQIADIEKLNISKGKLIELDKLQAEQTKITAEEENKINIYRNSGLISATEATERLIAVRDKEIAQQKELVAGYEKEAAANPLNKDLQDKAAAANKTLYTQQTAGAGAAQAFAKSTPQLSFLNTYDTQAAALAKGKEPDANLAMQQATEKSKAAGGTEVQQKEAANAAKLASDQKYSRMTTANNLSMYSGIAGMGADTFMSLTQASAKMYGAQSKQAKAAFMIYKMLKTAEIIMSTAALAMKMAEVGAGFGPAAVVMVPLLVGTAIVLGAVQLAMLATAPMPAAHGGLTNVPAEQTYLLQKGERVLSPNQNADLNAYMKQTKIQNTTQSSGVTIGAIHVTVPSKEGATSDEQAAAISKAIREQMKDMIQSELVSSQRPGGTLNPTQLSATF